MSEIDEIQNSTKKTSFKNMNKFFIYFVVDHRFYVHIDQLWLN